MVDGADYLTGEKDKFYKHSTPLILGLRVYLKYFVDNTLNRNESLLISIINTGCKTTDSDN